MKKFCLYLFLLFPVIAGYAQATEKTLAKAAEKAFAKKTRKDRSDSYYANRKYSYGMAEQWYGFHSNSTVYSALDVFVADRFKGLTIGNIIGTEGTAGFSFQPYQGFRLHAGVGFEWLTGGKVHLYGGVQYALGLTTRTIASNSESSVTVGCHSYVVPFIGVMYWPFKRDYNPTFWHLAYLKWQVNYSSLIGEGSVTPTALFPPATVSNIVQNVSSGLYLSFGIGLNLPTFKGIRLFTFPFL
jgi:hypothetical protein